MDDGRGEWAGEQTLSMPAITDDPPGSPVQEPKPDKVVAGPPAPARETEERPATPGPGAEADAKKPADVPGEPDTGAVPEKTPADAVPQKPEAEETPAKAASQEPEPEETPAEAGKPEAKAAPEEPPAEAVPDKSETEIVSDTSRAEDVSETSDAEDASEESSTGAVSEESGAEDVSEKPDAGDVPEKTDTDDVPEENEDEKPRERVEALPPETAEAVAAALGTLRESVASLRFGLDLPGAGEARKASAELLAQLEDYVLPRVRMSTAPALIVVAGSTGAGKSTLVNSLAEKNVSRTGVRRPTTGMPVLVCHPEDREWFAEGELLGGLRRIDQAGADPDRRAIVIHATEKLPQGVALLDTPDIDSVVEEHHAIAHRMLDAADLWIFVTTAARYADAPAWNLLRLAKERGARLAIVLSRVQDKARDVVLKHFVRMLTEYGLGEIDRFVIGESKVVDGRLPDSEMTELRMWLAELSVDEARRAQAVRETLNGVLDSFRTRVPALAKHLEKQVAFRGELRADVDGAYVGALTDLDKAFRSGALIHGEVLARWQDFAGSGDLLRSIQLRKRARNSRQTTERIIAFRAALRSGLESVIVAAATRAAEEVTARWRHRAEAGAALAAGLERPSDDLVRHASRAVAAWQEHVTELVRTEGIAKRTVSRLVSFDADALSLIFMVAMFSGGQVEGVPARLVKALLGAESLRAIGAKALSDLRARISLLFDEESMRYVQALDSAGVPDESAATRLYQATYNLEVAR
ncbi:dynamin family protein [Nonomuraea sp. NPDC049649]|uniref:dynamin family protein n=1 Tax=Nonomuraea sp. NPDC049649 TaxID=3155776 RepID=UPI003420BD12